MFFLNSFNPRPLFYHHYSINAKKDHIDQLGIILYVLKSVSRLFHIVLSIFLLKPFQNAKEIPNFHRVIHIDNYVINC